MTEDREIAEISCEECGIVFDEDDSLNMGPDGHIYCDDHAPSFFTLDDE